MAATSPTAALNADSFAFDGALNPLSFRTNWSDAARISSSVAGGSTLKSVLLLRHIFDLRRGFPRVFFTEEHRDHRERHVDAGRHARRRDDRVPDDAGVPLNQD